MKDVYIQKQEPATSTQQCGFCAKLIDSGIQIYLEDRSSWFRGDDESFWVHQSCFSKAENEERVKQEKADREYAAYADRQERNLAKLLIDLRMDGIEIVTFNHEQHWRLSFNGIKVDWWPSTGTLLGHKTVGYVSSNDANTFRKIFEISKMRST